MKWLAILLATSIGTALAKTPKYEIQLDRIHKGYDGKTCWVHPRAAIIPGPKPEALMTLWKLTVTGSDLYGPIADMRSTDSGRTWTLPEERVPTLGRRAEANGVECGVCDFTPAWHAATGKVLAVGHTVRYKNDKVVEDCPRETAYTVYDPASKTWSEWATLRMPEEPRFYNSGAGCVQRVDLPDGSILIPTYYKQKGHKDASVTVMHCDFDGRTLSLKRLGNELKLSGNRGLGEPSLTVFRGQYYLTLRNDAAGYVSTSRDGLNYSEPVKWCFDDGEELGNYNTQQHWVTHTSGLFLVYTRKGANNDHVFRHRAPLFMAEVDPSTLRVIRSSERILVPDRGARLGNFGVTRVSPTETWVTVAEWMQTWPPQKIIPVANPRGADNSVYVARILWKTPDEPDMASERRKAADRQRRIIYNNDGGETAMEMKEATAKAFLDCRTTKLASTQVDSIFYCSRSSGFGVFTHFTKVGQVFTCTEGRYAGNQTGAMLKAGLDPLKLQIDFAQKNKIELFWSMRMNDTHDGATADYGPIMFKDNQFKQAHPEYLLGRIDRPLKHGKWSAVDYGRPEIRDLAFRFIEEVCLNYDVDGVELDFFRHPVFFKSTARGEPATAEELMQMTDLMKRIRTMADTRGRQRGKPILLAVKLPDSLEYCKTIGLDLEQWMKNGLFDLFIPCGYFQLNEWDYSIALARKYGLKVYPSLDEPRLKDLNANAARRSPEAYRGRAADVLRSGGDGVYFFNFSEEKPQLLLECGDRAQLARRECDYFACPRGVGTAAGGNYPIQKFLKLETLNPGNPKPLAAGKNVVSHVRVGNAPDPQAIVTLRIQAKKLPSSAAVTFNTKPVKLQTAGQDWWEASLQPQLVKAGENSVAITLTEGSPAAQWTDLKINVKMPAK